MKIQAKIVADSKNEFGNRLTTMVVTFPRFILAELNTHRMFSRNSASSRAIPFEKMLKSVQENPFIPMAWQKDHSGMQGSEYFTEEVDIDKRRLQWFAARDEAVECAKSLATFGVTKQICNRILEPFMWHTVIISETEWENMFYLRCPKYIFHTGDEDEEFTFRSRKDVIKRFGEDEAVEYETGNVALKDLIDLQWLQLNKGQAEIHMMALAEAMWDAYNESTPKELKAGEWHIPFEEGIHIDGLQGIRFTLKDGSTQYQEALWFTEQKIKIATAMCARVSYTVVGEENKAPNYENDIKLHDRLAESGHWSPTEHIARAMTTEEMLTNISGKIGADEFQLDNSDGFPNYVNPTGISIENPIAGWSGNFRGFCQYRKMFNNENITK